MSTSKAGSFIGKYWKNQNFVYIAVAAVIFLVAGGYWLYQAQRTNVPSQFLEARSQAATTAENIVKLTDASVATLRLISIADEEKNYKRGKELVTEEVDRNAVIKQEAFKLSEELKIMALSLGEVKPKRATEAGLEATTKGLELAQHLVSYNNYFNELLAVLDKRFQSNSSLETRQKIDELILKMNEEAEAVNRLNLQYQDLMKEFDRLTG